MHIIKPVRESDLEALADIFSRVFSEADKEKPWDKEHAHQYLAYWFKKQPDMFFGAFDESGKPVGAVAANIKPWRTGVRCSDGVVFVDAEYQRQGIAKSLLKKALEEAMQKYGAVSFEAVTFAGKEFPLTWYERIGVTPDTHAVLIKGNCREILDKLS